MPWYQFRLFLRLAAGKTAEMAPLVDPCVAAAQTVRDMAAWRQRHGRPSLPRSGPSLSPFMDDDDDLSR